MDKIKINNQIVLMRKFVKQSKVHNINRLVKQIKLLQNRKGNEAQVLKAKRKANRFLEEVTVLKKIKPDDVSKLALSKEKDWNSVLKQKNIPLDDRCIAMLANYESVQTEVEKFYTENHDMVPRIVTLLKEWNSKSKRMNNKSSNNVKLRDSKFEGNRKKLDQMPRLQNDTFSLNHDESKKNVELEDKDANTVSVGKENNAATKSNVRLNTKVNKNLSNITSELENKDEIIQHCSSNEGDYESETNDESQGSSQNSEDDLEICQKSLLQRVSAPFKVNPESDENKQENESMASNMHVATLENISYKISPIDILSKSKSNMKTVAVLNLEQLQGFDEIPINKTSDLEENNEDEIPINKSSDEESSDNEIKTTKSDPFFLGSHEASFVSESDPGERDEKAFRNIESHASEKPKFTKRYYSDNLCSKIKKFSASYQNGKSYDLKNEELHSKNHEKNRYQKTDERNFKKFPQSYQSKSTNKFKSGDMHFEHCKKERYHTDVRNFKMMNNKGQNKSNMFRNNRNHFNEVQPKHTASKSHFFDDKQKSSSKKSKKTDDLPLHPSWEAKRKLKAVANASFKGKRVVFGD